MSRQNQILLAAYNDLVYWRSQQPQATSSSTGTGYSTSYCGWKLQEIRQHNAAIEDANRGIVLICAARWLGRELTPSDRTSNSYTYAALQKRGLIELQPARDDYGQKFRSRDFRFTPEGERVAAELLAAEQTTEPVDGSTTDAA